MADRSMMFAAKAIPTAEATDRSVIGLAEFAYGVPTIFKLLASVDAKPCRSIIFDSDAPAAVAADAREGLRRLESVRARLDASAAAADSLDEAIDYLSQPHLLEFPFYLLEPGEIFSLSSTPIEQQLDALLAEINRLDLDELAGRARKSDKPLDWATGCWTDILYYRPKGSVRPPIDPKATLLFTSPEHILENRDRLAQCALTDVHVAFKTPDGRLDDALRALAAVPHPFGLTLNGPCERLPPAVTSLTNLSRLGAGQVGLEALPDDLGALANLEGLYVQNNRLTRFPAVRGLTRLKNLSVWDNPIGSVPDWIGELEALESLTLEQCGLSGLPAGIWSLRRLERLGLAENPALGSLPTEVAGLVSLKTLLVYRCGLRELPSSLGTLPRLKELFAGGNHITSVPPSVRRMRLDVLSLVGNPLKTGFWGRPSYRARKVFLK
jgi:hypothetical protein